MSLATIATFRQRQLYRFILDSNQQPRHHSQNSEQRRQSSIDQMNTVRCRHLAIAFCRSMNIQARYCTGYLGDIGLPPPYDPMDFAPGSRRISKDAGIPSTRATTRHGLDGY
jgi:hypothetical protein